jgi:hypothetical protein
MVDDSKPQNPSHLFGKTTTCLGISQLVGAICRVYNFFSVKESTNYNQF